MMPWSTTSVTSQPASFRRDRRAWRASSSGRANERWSNCDACGVGTPAGLAKKSRSTPWYSKKATVDPGPNSKK